MNETALLPPAIYFGDKMTVTHEETDIDFFTIMDFDPDIKCNPMTEDCENTATWLAIHPCCKAETPQCDQHREKSLRFLKRIMAAGLNNANCKHCKTNVPIPEILANIHRI